MRELPILTNCGVSSFSNSALFKLRERRFSLRIRVIFSCSEREMTQLHILTRLDAEQHLRYEPSERLCQALTELRGKLRQLRFESGSNFAIVHRGTPPWWFGFLGKTLLLRMSSPPTSQSRQATDLSRVRLSVLQILGKLLEEGTLSTRRSRWIRRESMPPGMGSWQPGRLRYREAKKKPHARMAWSIEFLTVRLGG